MEKLDLPKGITACLFDLDGVITQTAKVHLAAWTEMFNGFLQERSDRGEEPFRSFSPTDYTKFVDGRLRLDGVRTFLNSRSISLDEGSPQDLASAETINGLGTRKDDLVQVILKRDGVEAYDGSLRFVRVARELGLRRAVVSASKNCGPVLAAAGIADLFEVQIDGIVAAEQGLAGKPAPDTFLAAASALGVTPEACALFEDAVAGVQAGRAGDFGWVVGVDRMDIAQALRDGGADTVVTDLAQLLKDD